MITGFYAGLLAMFLVVLILRIVRCRWKFKVGLGDGGIKELEQNIRIHGNFIETVPVLLILLFLLETNGTPELALHVFGISIILSRCLHAFGLRSSPTVSFGRTFGTVMTNALLVIGGITLIVQFIS